MAPFKITLKEKRRKAVAKVQQLQPQPQAKNGNVDAALGPITRKLRISFTLPRNRGPSSVPSLSKNRSPFDNHIHLKKKKINFQTIGF